MSMLNEYLAFSIHKGGQVRWTIQGGGGGGRRLNYTSYIKNEILDVLICLRLNESPWPGEMYPKLLGARSRPFGTCFKFQNTGVMLKQNLNSNRKLHN